MLLTSNKKLKKILSNSSIVLAIFLIARFLFGF